MDCPQFQYVYMHPDLLRHPDPLCSVMVQMGSPTHEGGVRCDGGLRAGRGEGGPDHDLRRVGPTFEGGQNHLGEDDNAGVQMSLVGSVDGEEP